ECRRMGQEVCHALRREAFTGKGRQKYSETKAGAALRGPARAGEYLGRWDRWACLNPQFRGRDSRMGWLQVIGLPWGSMLRRLACVVHGKQPVRQCCAEVEVVVGGGSARCISNHAGIPEALRRFLEILQVNGLSLLVGLGINHRIGGKVE